MALSARCFVCRRRPTAVGALCEACADGLERVPGLLPEQLDSPLQDADRAWLVDPWGRLHPVGRGGVIGRRGDLLQVHSPGVSRRHAQLTRDGGGCRVEDLASKHGTTVDGRPVTRPTALSHGARIGLGELTLWFAEGEPTSEHPRASDSPTASPGVTRLPSGLRRTVVAGRPFMVELLEPSAAEGGFLVVAERRIQVTLLQLCLLERLVGQLAHDVALPEPVRGYVPSVNLLAELPWATPKAEPPHLKQLVRRTRRLLAGTGLRIDAAQGFGYRLWSE